MEKFKEITLDLKGKKITLKESDPSSAGKSIEFLNQVGLESIFTYNYPGQELNAEMVAKRMETDKNSATTLRIQAFHDDKIVGQIGLWKVRPDHPWLTHKAEFAMMTLKEMWGSGLAQILMDEIHAFAKQIVNPCLGF